MQRTYLALAGVALASAVLPAALPTLVEAAGVFQSQPLDSARFALLARPLASGDWSLLVLEQIQPSPLCWQQRSDGLIDPVLNRFDYTGICGRYLDSNGYSLRVGNEDLGGSYRLTLEQLGTELQLQATSPSQPTVLVLGRARVAHRDRDAFVALTLDPGWELQRRIYGERSLNHVYLANAGSLGELAARAGGSRPSLPRPPLAMAAVQPPPPIAPPSLALPQRRSTAALRQRRTAPPSALESALQGVKVQGVNSSARNTEPAPQLAQPVSEAAFSAEPMLASGQAIPLQVIPYRE